MSRSNLNRKAKDRQNALLSLIYLCGGKEYFLAPSQTYEPLALYFNLTDSERNENQNDRRGDFRNHWEILLQNSRQQLVSRGFLDKSKREVWKLTPKGIIKAQQISNDFKILENIFVQEDNHRIKIPSYGILFQDEDDEMVFVEGKDKYLLHRTKERKHGLITLVKNKMYLKNPDLPCFVCGFSFSQRYGKHGEHFIEAHHLIPISELTEETEIRVEDIVLVCSNCHKMIHRFRPWLAIDELKTILNLSEMQNQ